MPSDVTIPRNLGPICRSVLDVMEQEAASRGVPGARLTAQYDVVNRVIFVYVLREGQADWRYGSAMVPLEKFPADFSVPPDVREVLTRAFSRFQ